MLLLIQSVLPQKYRSKVEQLYYEYRNDMFYTAIGILKNKEQAEDIVQFAFLRIMKYIEKINSLPSEEVRGYIIYIIKNLSIDYIRKQKRENTIPFDNMDFSGEYVEPIENIAMANLELSLVKKKLEDMDDKYALPLILKYTLEFSHAEIADFLNLSVENVKVRCHRGRHKLIEAIREEAVSDSEV